MIGVFSGSIYGGIKEQQRIDNVINNIDINTKLEQNIYSEIINKSLLFGFIGLISPYIILISPLLIPLCVIESNNMYIFNKKIKELKKIEINSN